MDAKIASAVSTCSYDSANGDVSVAIGDTSVNDEAPAHFGEIFVIVIETR